MPTGLTDTSPRSVRGPTAGRSDFDRISGAVIVLAVAAGVVWSNVLAYGGASLAPYGQLVELDKAQADDAYSTAIDVIIGEARKLAGIKPPEQSRRSLPLVALVVWEGAPRGPGDNTNRFVELAQESDFRVEQILTLTAATEPRRQ